jgi:short-subunit dehydrogenase
MNETQRTHTLITGASLGIGRALAIECARRNMNLALIDLPDAGLPQTINYLEKHYSVDIRSLEVDLTTPNSAENIYDWTRRQNITVRILINNAGKGHLGAFTDYGHTFYGKMVRLNIESVVLLTRLFLPEMKKLERAYIMNLGSIASFYPIPYKIVYAGSKSFIYSFSRALKEELRNTPVSISVLCPGPILTNTEVIKRIRRGGYWARLSAMRPAKMARIAISALLSGKSVIIPGGVNRFFRTASMLVPTPLKQRLLARKFSVREKI